MSCFNFDFMLVGQVLLNEAACSGAYQRSNTSSSPQRSLSSPLQPSQDNLCFYSSFSTALCDDLSFYERETGASSPHPSSSACPLYSIPEEDEEAAASDDDDDEEEEVEDEEYGHAFDAPFLRFFKSCFVQFAYMMPMDKTK